MTPREIVYKVLKENLDSYLELDPNCTYVHSLFYHIHSNEKLKKQFPFTYDEQIESRLDALERSLLNWLMLAEVKTFNEENNELTIFFKDGISLLISNGVYYFKKDVIFSIIYPEHLNYNAFTTYLSDIALDIESKNFQKIIKLA